ncbi:glycosyltransferase [Candidatus Sumerlaeota bacterium]|nr:glycosyltransferase [Candidatus Sumerlaeota bacterium]
MKVLRVIYDLQVGGVQRMLFRSIEPLRAAGVVLEVVCLKERGEMAPRFEEAGVPVHLVRFGSRLDPIGIWKLNRLIRRNGYHVAHSQMYAANAALNAAALLGFDAKVVNSYHSQTPFSGSSQLRFARWTAKTPARVVAVSHVVKDAVAEAGIDRDAIRVIHNGVELPEDEPPPPLSPLGSPLRAFWAGRFVKQKRVDLLVDIAAGCRRVGVPLLMSLIGEGPQLEKIKRRVEELNLVETVRFVPFQDDIVPHIREHEVYLSASDREGFPNTLLEVFAQGRGALVTKIAPNAEAIGESGAGKLISDDLEEWVNWLRVLQGDRQWIATMGEAARRRAQEFSVEQSCAAMVRLYHEVCAGTNNDAG